MNKSENKFPDKSSSALEFQQVRHRFGSLVAVDGVDLHINRGEIVCLLGPSGCGKSTILRLAAGLEELKEGGILLRGENVAKPHRSLPPEERGIGLVFQDFALFPHLNVAENIAFGLRRVGNEEKNARVQVMLQQIGMEHSKNAYPHTLSGGQQQRVALARALAPNPSVLLLDEPFSGLDQRLREQIRDDTLRVLRNNGTATLLVTHDPEEAMFMADRIYLMKEGRVEQSGSPFELYHHPVSPFAVEFFGPANKYICSRDGQGWATPFGKMIFPDHPAVVGEKIHLLVRPEAVLPHRQGRSQARIESLHFLGAGALLDLRLKDGLLLKAHLADLLAWGKEIVQLEKGADFSFDLAPSRIFVFPHDQ